MQSGLLLRPTPWRTCRAIANRRRLGIIALLIAKPGLTVTTVSEAAGLRQPTATQYLRVLESRGLLEVRRIGRYAHYRLAAANQSPFARGIVTALLRAFAGGSGPVESVFKAATAFTHPRRIEIFRALLGSPKTLLQIRAATRIPIWALHRHLQKLEARRFVFQHAGRYVVAPRRDVVGRALAQLAAE